MPIENQEPVMVIKATETKTGEPIADINVLAEKVGKLTEPKKIIIFVGELPCGDTLLNLFDHIGIDKTKGPLVRYLDSFKTTETWRDVEKVLYEISRDTEITVRDKSDFLGKIRVVSSDLLCERIADSIDDNFQIKAGTPEPITSSYIPNLESSNKFFDELNSVRLELKKISHVLIYKDLEEYEEAEKLKNAPSEITKRIAARLNAFTPTSKETSSAIELIKFLNRETLSEEESILSQLQYIRLLKEKVNVMVSENHDSKLLLENREVESGPIRIGDSASSERTRLTRRHTAFTTIHFGATEARSLNSKAEKNIIGLDPKTKEIVEDLKRQENNGGILSKITEGMTPEQKFHMAWVKENRGIEITSEDRIDITKKFLEKLGISSDPITAEKQINAFKGGENLDQKFSTIAVTTIDTATSNAFDSKRKLIIIPASSVTSKLEFSISTMLHELTHALQSMRRDSSPVELISKINNLGRYLILGEMGAMKNEEAISEIFREKPEYWAEYDYGIIEKYVQGSTFMDLFQLAFKQIYENENGIKELDTTTIRPSTLDRTNKFINLKKFETASTVLRRVMRLYKDLGATGQSEIVSQGLYPSTWSMAYLYGEIPKYTQYPSTLSGIPTHRLDELQELLPEFMINSEKITDEMIIKLFIDSVYEEVSNKPKTIIKE